MNVVKKYFAALVLVSVICLSSCVGNQDGYSFAKGDVISFGSSFIRSTRTDFECDQDGRLTASWSGDEIVGIFCKTSSIFIGNNVAYGTLPNKSNYKEALFCPIGETIEWSSEDTHLFYAYSPYNVSTTDPKSVPFSLPSIQVQKSASSLSHLSKYNFMWAKPVSASLSNSEALGERADVNLCFYQLFSVVEIRLYAEKGMIGQELLKAVLMSDDAPLTMHSGRADITQSIDSMSISYDGIASRSIVLTFEENPLLNADCCSIYFVAAAGNHAQGALSIELLFASGQTIRRSFEPISLQSNTHYVEEVTIDGTPEIIRGATMPLCISFGGIDGMAASGLKYGQIIGNTIVYSNGITLSRENRSETVNDTLHTSDFRFYTTLTDKSDEVSVMSETPSVCSSAWSIDAGSAYMLAVPLAEKLSGEVRMDFKFASDGFANWVVEWSSDGELWHFFTDGRFTHGSAPSTVTYAKYFTIPEDETIGAGGLLYIRLRPTDNTAAAGVANGVVDASMSPRLVHSIVLTNLVNKATKFDDNNVLYSNGFDNCVEGVDVVGLGLDQVRGLYNIDGMAFTNATAWQNGTYEKWLPQMSYIGQPVAYERHGYIRIGNTGAKGSLVTPPLSIIENGKAIIDVAFKAATHMTNSQIIDNGDIVVNIVSDGIRSSKSISIPSDRFRSDEWRSSSVRFSGVNNGDCVEFTSSVPMRFYLDDIVITQSAQ